jgi:choline monooxygenase
MIFNFYPWGYWINIVKPIALNQTKVSFLTYVYDESKLDTGAGTGLDKVEREDKFVVEGVFKGMSSRVYQTGRFSPKIE